MSAVDRAVARLQEAEATGVPCAPVRDLVGVDVDLAYAVQQRLIADRVAAGSRVIGRKIGLTSAAVQRQLGVDRPDFGVLLDDMDVSALAEVPSARLLQPKAEAELAFVLGDDLAPTHVAAALEIVDSRIRGWDITLADTVADNASSGLFVVGELVPIGAVVPREVTMRLYADGELVSQGSGADCLGDPLVALDWLARTAAAFGNPLRPGQVVLSGALGPMVPTPPGTRIHAEIDGVGSVDAHFSKETR
ncbi:2-keto-4-pentenoate hydratase [Nocardioides sp. Root1257]|uniref:2-keto-4-pentenoate hydratase n=1 Tax=unclassified Nocardioides TaxID=2615069 RepID=UPI0006FEB5AA|nr:MULTISPECIES: fumarylacetoacetate hydrolase family protein [unclassified Nocardioides]KQW47407.1 2-keto-4-pentenoate hydratase [Nocardioides sp. Root1257]KRC45563.1 2-keto-4-pentenoate hydratase [Nocardioides sp. Root224]